jgi:hypothetical protein
VAAGWSEQQARDANVHELAATTSNRTGSVTMGTTLMPPFRTARTTRDQAIAALGEANRVRLRRASLMRWLYGARCLAVSAPTVHVGATPAQATCVPPA